ncbi:hypothetical protein CRG98_018983 [Punica granatum]|uniref:Uncharacterized protein n=1 Tax=Punica granatum TaxID=22663 RepID=A0A2I0JXR0_PUNGR|nr:hypothetical protein CRG98_018983 [Punica granatum]
MECLPDVDDWLPRWKKLSMDGGPRERGNDIPKPSEDLWGLERQLSHSIRSPTRNLFLVLAPIGTRGISSKAPK